MQRCWRAANNLIQWLVSLNCASAMKRQLHNPLQFQFTNHFHQIQLPRPCCLCSFRKLKFTSWTCNSYAAAVITVIIISFHDWIIWFKLNQLMKSFHEINWIELMKNESIQTIYGMGYSASAISHWFILLLIWFNDFN